MKYTITFNSIIYLVT